MNASTVSEVPMRAITKRCGATSEPDAEAPLAPREPAPAPTSSNSRTLAASADSCDRRARSKAKATKAAA